MSRDFVIEDVPRLNRRVSDTVLSGPNNSVIILGRDRNGTVESGYGSLNSSNSGKNAGSVSIIAGRVNNDPSVLNDSASLYISAKTDPDDILKLNVGEQQKEQSAIVGRADCIRISARKDIKLTSENAFITISSDGKITISGNISLGKDASQRLLLADAFSQFWATVIVATPSGPASPLPPLPANVFTQSVLAK